ncbi:MAG TPA: GNAT family N-acetyltransferase [Steroidobacteraceae bacterium]|nr:GNAT family N-acetyltransferase [Steroidobacteraceae bacterium]
MIAAAPLSFHAGMADFDAAAWNALAGDYPFLRHEFLAALETSGCVAPATGWTPRHLRLGEAARPLALAPLYEKSHSWGEFVFDFAWARAWEGRGKAYYPKLLLAIPFTPATGPRLLCAGEDEPARAAHCLAVLRGLEQDAQRRGRSSVHALFIDEALQAAAREAGWLLRRDCHFQWQNRAYRDFEDFLAGFSSDKRKKVRRERRRIAEQGIEFRTHRGSELDGATLERLHDLHAATFLRHGHLPYLNAEFFRLIATTMGEAFIAVLAEREREIVAAALYFRSGSVLYGRYWGAAGDFHSLHFECCYYQGIDYCIQHGLQRFEPGTQGEHKLARGFEPVLTWSAHWLADRALRTAVARYLEREAASVTEYADAAARHTPFRA